MKTNSEREKEETRGSPPDESSLPKPASTKRLAISLLIKIAAIALAVWLVFTFVLGITINYGNNMHPAVNDGDLVITLKLQRPYLNADKAEGSAVSFPYTVEEGKAFILNDYREDTDDSRIFGAVDMKDIDGPFLFTLRRRGF